MDEEKKVSASGRRNIPPATAPPGGGVRFLPIGAIHSPFQGTEGMPIQPAGARDVSGTVEVMPEYERGLADLAGFSHIILLYWFHLSQGYSLIVTPFLDDQPRGLFATRAPRRPNPLGLSVVRLVGISGCRLEIQGVDVVDGTPLLDLKPFVPRFDAPAVERIGWLAKGEDGASEVRADGRFRVS